jgi:hypothetical protein
MLGKAESRAQEQHVDRDKRGSESDISKCFCRTA